MLANEPPRAPRQLGVPANREVCFDAPLEADKAKLFEPARLRLRERLVREVRQRRTSPEAERLAEEACRDLGWRPLRLGDEPLVLQEVELGRADADQIPRLLRDDGVAGREHLTQLGDVVLKRVRRAARRRCRPELVDQPVRRDDFVRAREQQREECALPRSAERE